MEEHTQPSPQSFIAVSTLEAGPGLQELDAVVLGIQQEDALTPTFEKLISNQNTKGELKTHIARDLGEKPGATLWLRGLPGLPSNIGVLAVRCAKDLDDRGYQEVVLAAATILQEKNSASKKPPLQTVLMCLPELTVVQTLPHGEFVQTRTTAWKVRQAISILSEALHPFSLKSKKSVAALPKQIWLGVSEAVNQAVIPEACHVAYGKQLAAMLTNLPANQCGPEVLALYARRLERLHSALVVDVFSLDDILYAGMNGIISVGQGSGEEPLFIEAKYTGNPNDKRKIVVVGKGVCFDSGGLNLKSEPLGMHYDKAGAAAALGWLQAVASEKLPINAVVLIPAVMNMTGDNAYKPGDVFQNVLGQSIEVTNTDAEGRLILMEAIGYAISHIPNIAVLVDIATLTGVMRAAFHKRTALFSNHAKLQQLMFEAGEETGDLSWPMPLDLRYEPLLSEETPADFKNYTAGPGGGILAALFLYQAVKKGAFPWIHMDIAGSAYDQKTRLATGFPVPSLFQFTKKLLEEKIL
ncbi:MAG: leucyl aminopeptidase family protein [Gammaproteobacteria bacterium]|nr:leucyl aminopeptidase family protein [Gammaproteobacteria bacterium]